MTWLVAPRRRLDELSPDPRRGWVSRHVDVHQLAPAVGDEHEHVQRLEGERGYREQVGRPEMVIGSKDGALRHYCRTFPPSALRTGQATRRCTQLASNVQSPPGMFVRGWCHP